MIEYPSPTGTRSGSCASTELVRHSTRHAMIMIMDMDMDMDMDTLRYRPVSSSGSRPGTPDDRTGTPPARITRTGPLGAQEAVSAVSSVTTTCGSGGNRYGGLVYYYIPHRGTHREHRGNAIAALLCGSLVACRPPGDLKNTTNPH